MPRRKDTKAVETAIGQFQEQLRLVNDLHPENDAEKLFYRTYRLAHAHRPDDHFVCHGCMRMNPIGSAPFIKGTLMASHCRIFHNGASIKCDYKSCSVMFEYQEEKEKHQKFVHETRFGWWIPTEGSL